MPAPKAVEFQRLKKCEMPKKKRTQEIRIAVYVKYDQAGRMCYICFADKKVMIARHQNPPVNPLINRLVNPPINPLVNPPGNTPDRPSGRLPLPQTTLQAYYE